MRPELSVAIIFKNEIRCLERCLKSLLPLKEHVSCEIVMADTGSTDGSRAVAEKYADEVFDFPWINDFAAARNAVLERCTGKWVLAIDCDEWFDGVPEELVSFLKSKEAERFDIALNIVRNYTSSDFCLYQDFSAARLLRMGAKPRYRGAVHEMPVFSAGSGENTQLYGVILHHDGYVMLNDGSEEGKAKLRRDAELLRAELEKTPDDLRRLLQYLDVREEDRYQQALRHAAALVIKKRGDWKGYGPAIMSRAVAEAYVQKMPELDSWVDAAARLFPQSYYTRIDIAFVLLVSATTKFDCEKMILYGEEMLEAHREFLEDPNAYEATSYSPLKKNTEYWMQYARLRLAAAYQKTGQVARALSMLEQTVWTLLDEANTAYFLVVLKQFAGEGYDIGPLLNACWEGIHEPVPSAERAAERVAAFNKQVRVEDAEPEPEPRANEASAELAQLAAQVKAILERFPPDDPAIIDLKNSEAYRKVAWLIEGGAV